MRKRACPDEGKAPKLNVLDFAHDSSTRVVEAGGSGIEGHPQLYNELIPG